MNEYYITFVVCSLNRALNLTHGRLGFELGLSRDGLRYVLMKVRVKYGGLQCVCDSIYD